MVVNYAGNTRGAVISRNSNHREDECSDGAQNDFFAPKDEEISKCMMREDANRGGEHSTVNYFLREMQGQADPNKNCNESFEGTNVIEAKLKCDCELFLDKLRKFSQKDEDHKLGTHELIKCSRLRAQSGTHSARMFCVSCA